MTAISRLQVDAPLPLQNGYQPGNLGVVNRDPSHAIIVRLDGQSGSEQVVLVNDGDSMGIELTGIGSAEIRSGDDTYPIFILLLNSQLDIALSAAPVIGNTADDPVPVTVV